MGLLDSYFRLPLNWLGFKNLPAVPVILNQLPGTLIKLNNRKVQITQATNGLSNVYTIDGQTYPAINFLYSDSSDSQTQADRDHLLTVLQGDAVKVAAYIESVVGQKDLASAAPSDPLTALTLTDPGQFAMSWTMFDGVYESGEPFLAQWSASFTDKQAATDQFWPTIANYGLAYNLLFVQKLSAQNDQGIKNLVGASWSAQMDTLEGQGLLYAIDLTIFASVKPAEVKGFPRFTPAVLVLLQQDAATKKLTPFFISVSGYQGADKQNYHYDQATDGAWLYALQAAKAAVTVYGIWIGHVGHWHLPTAALQMTMFNNLPATHPVAQLLTPQSDYLIAFDDILLLAWGSIAPPTSLSTAYQFIEFMNTYFAGYSYFNDDPDVTLQRLNIQAADFSSSPETPWDLYPIVKHFLTVWEGVKSYVQVFVDTTYANDDAVKNDSDLQKWASESQNPSEGNVGGFPALTGKAILARALTSFLYRITMHGCGRLSPAANPGLSFVGNYPPCLQRTDIPQPDATLTTGELLAYLPKTGTIGEVLSFYNIFVFSSPYEPYLPKTGDDTELFFAGGATEPRNAALIALRQVIRGQITDIYNGSGPMYFQWPLNIET